MTAVPPSADPETDGPSAGYYPDPSIPGFVRYWDGLGWLPGTSRPAPGPDEVLPPPRAAARQNGPSMRFVPPPVRSGRPEPEPEREAVVEVPAVEPEPEPEPEPFVPQRALPPLLPLGGAGAVEQSGPIFLDETGVLPEPRAAAPAAVVAEESASRWIADAAQQRGLMETGAAPRWVSWGVAEPQAAPQGVVAEAAPVAPAAPTAPEAPAPAPTPAPAPAPVPVPPAPGPAPAPRRPAPAAAVPVRTLGPVPSGSSAATGGGAGAG
ncbi:DUF2510 domain-containing protein, partial [Streptacidiphilus sp. N1-10]